VTGLGDRLREARTAKGFTLDDLQSITKIQKRYLSGIENEDYSMMPGSFYVRAFIKQYAEAVGLDSDEMLALYKDNSPTTMPEEEASQLTSPTLTRRRGLQGNNQFNEMMPKIIVALFIIVIIVVVWVLYQSGPSKKPDMNVGQEQQPITVEKKPDSNQTDPGKVTEEPKVDPVEEQPEKEPEIPIQSLVLESTSGETSTYELTGTDAFHIEIRTSGDSWIGVLDSSKKERMIPKADIMKAGDTAELDVSDTDSVRIRVGRTQSTEIFVNGELLEYATDLITQNIIIEYKKEL
jgi:cytoskeletal protein RodZ